MKWQRSGFIQHLFRILCGFAVRIKGNQDNFFQKIKFWKGAGFIFDAYALWMIAAGAALNVALWYFLKHMLRADVTFVTLHFTAASGVDLIGEAKDLYNLPYWAALVSVANVVMARAMYHYDVLSSYVLLSALPLLNAFALFNGFLLVSVNG